MPATIVMLAEDEPVTRRSLTIILERMGFVVRTAADGAEGCAMLDGMKNDFPHLLITDVDMPGCGGKDLMDHARGICGDIKVLLTSGRPRPSLIEAIAEESGAIFLQKPFELADLLSAFKKLEVNQAGSHESHRLKPSAI
jgi:CheY-like chemotaxis protein